MEPRRESVTEILRSWRDGDASAFDRLVPIVYDELRSIAASYMRHERPDHTLQPTALVHDAFLRLASVDLPWQDRAHFFAVAARTMRRVLVDHARERAAVKRGRDWVRTTLDEGVVISSTPALELLDLDRALETLAHQDPRAAQAAELHYFGGLGYDETARALGISRATVHRELRFAKAWMRRALADGDQAP